MIFRIFMYCMVSLPCFSQTKTDSLEKRYYLSGHLKAIGIHKGGDTLAYRSYYKNGQMRDSALLLIRGRNEVVLGTTRTYYRNGRLWEVNHYGKDNEHYTRSIYRQDGSIKSIIHKPAGIHAIYYKNGQVKEWYDVNKGGQVKVSKNYKKHRHLTGSLYLKDIHYPKANLINKTHKQKMRTGNLITLFLSNDTNALRHCQVEGFSDDAIIISKFSYDLSDSPDCLRYDSTCLIPFNTIKLLSFSKRNARKTFNAGVVLTFIGVEFVVVPLIAGTIVSGVSILTDPFILSMIATGVVSYYSGRYLFRSMVPKTYRMDEWKIKPRL